MAETDYTNCKYMRKIIRLEREKSKLTEDLSQCKAKLERYATLIIHLSESLRFYKGSFRNENGFPTLPNESNTSSDSEYSESAEKLYEDDIPKSEDFVIITDDIPKSPDIAVCTEPGKTNSQMSSTNSLKNQVSWSDNVQYDYSRETNSSSLSETDVLDLNTLTKVDELFPDS